MKTVKCNEESLNKYREEGQISLFTMYTEDLCSIVIDGQAVALISSSEEEYGLDIDEFEVLKSFQRKGFGTQIIDEIKKKHSEISVYPSNQGAKQFWEAQGFIMQDDGTGTSIWSWSRSE